MFFGEYRSQRAGMVGHVEEDQWVLCMSHKEYTSRKVNMIAGALPYLVI